MVRGAAMLSQSTPTFRATTACAGFTLIETLVTVAMAAILASVAYPSLAEQVRKARRVDAVQALAQAQLAQERWRANCPCYAASLEAPSGSCPALACSPSQGLGMGTLSAGRHYTLALRDVSATGYTLWASAAPGSPQAQDRTCATMGVTVRNGLAAQWPTGCWSR